MAEFGDALETCFIRVQNEQKSGSVTLTISIEPFGSGKVQIKDGIAAKNPQPKKETTLFFLTEDGRPTRKNPSQLAMSED